MRNKQSVRAYAIAITIAFFFSLSLSAQTVRNQNLSKIKIENFGSYGDHYYRGAQPKGQDFTDLASLGVKTVINLTSDDVDPNEKAMVEKNGMTYIQIPMNTHIPPTASELAEFLGIVNDPAQQPVFVHCVGGKHRTGVMSAVYRMTHDSWTADQAFEEMKRFKFGASFLHPEFKKFVYNYSSQFAAGQPSQSPPVAAKSAN